MTALLHKLVVDTFQRTADERRMPGSLGPPHLLPGPGGLKDTSSARSIAERQEAWATDLPGTTRRCGIGSAALDETRSRLSLLAHCVSFGVNALFEKPAESLWIGNGFPAWVELSPGRPARPRNRPRHGGGRLDADGRQLSRPRAQAPHPRSRARGRGRTGAQLIDHLKKGDMAKEAERLLADTGWLPEPLRLADAERHPPGRRQRRPRRAAGLQAAWSSSCPG